MKIIKRIGGLGLLGMLAALGGCGGLDGSEQAKDPTVTEIPVAYVQRTPPQGDMDAMAQETLEDPAVFQAGARLMVRDSASSRAQARDVTTARLGAGHDIRDLSVSPDGT